jgi:hypothetical protein
MTIRVKEVKVDLSNLDFPYIEHINDGTLGIAVEQELIRQGFRVSTGTLDLPDYGLEIKTRKSKDSNAPHTVGTMTLENIINTDWEDTPLRKKLKNQFRVTFDGTGKVSKQEILHLEDDPDIDAALKKSYENARSVLKDHYAQTGNNLEESNIVGLDNKGAFFEYRSGNSYAFRIRPNLFKKFENLANVAPQFNALFSCE